MAGRGARRARASLARSQHFLRSGALASELVRDAGISSDDLVLDLGAGSGKLTAPLARHARRVVAVELDSRWAGRLRGRWTNVEVLEGDAARVELPGEPFRVVANLPFDCTTQILRHLLDDPGTPLVRADVIVEWGVAVKRAMPWPSTLNDVLWGASYRFTVTRRLPRAAYDPVPRVDTGVLAIERRERPLVGEGKWLAYRAFVASGFRRGLRSAVPRRVLAARDLGSAAARELDAYQWANLFEAAIRAAADTRRTRTAGVRR